MRWFPKSKSRFEIPLLVLPKELFQIINPLLLLMTTGSGREKAFNLSHYTTKMTMGLSSALLFAEVYDSPSRLCFLCHKMKGVSVTL
jgi:hypothetical protein